MKIFFSIFFVLCFFLTFAQKQDYNWCFSDSCGINFNTIPPSTFQSSINSMQCSATISNKNGMLLFYVGGIDFHTWFLRAWNNTHQLIDNSDSIYGQPAVTMGALIVPFVTDTNKFYLFHISAYNGDMHLYYSIIDVSFNNGLCKVISKNNLLFNNTNLSCKQVAVKHANGRDWWLILHEQNNNIFVKYLIANDHITGPFLQNIGSVFTSSNGGYWGEMDLSVDGDKIVTTNYWGMIDLFDFDRCTGVLSNWNNLGYSHYISYSGCAFSPKGNRLYVSQADSLFQFDLTVSSIITSRQTLWVNPFPLDHDIGQLQFGPDGKIYVANISGTNSSSTIFDSINMNLSVINFPNSLGSACDFQPYSFSLGGRRTYFNLPNIPNYNLGALEGSICDTLTTDENNIVLEKLKIYPNPTSDLLFVEAVNYNGINIQLFNNNVQLLETINLKLMRTKINLGKFPVGLYFLKIFSKKGMIIKKIIKT